MISVEYLLLMQCYKVTSQHLTVAEYYTCTFSADCTPMVRNLIAVLVICYMASVEYMLHMQCCMVAKMQPLITLCMLSSINTCLIVVCVTCLNSSVVEHLLSVQEVLSSILGLV